MRLQKLFSIAFLFCLCLNSCQEERALLFLGSYTERVPGEGIRVYDFDFESGASKEIFALNGITNPSFIRLSDDGEILYTISDSQLETNGFVSSYKVNSITGELSLISKESTKGRNPVHIEISPKGNFLSVSNYSDPSLSVFRLQADGSFGPAIQHFEFQDSSIVSGRQDEAHVHSSNFSRDGRFLYVHDLGADKIRTFLVGDTISDQAQEDVLIAAGSGPRHFTFDKEGKFAYLLCELSGEVHAFSTNKNSGDLEFLSKHSTYGQKQEIYRAADIHFSPNEKFLYLSNRGPEENTIAVFEKKVNGNLEFLQRVDSGGDHPRNFAIDQKGKLIIIANQFSNKVVIRSLDPTSGRIGEIVNEIDFPNVSTIQTYHYR